MPGTDNDNNGFKLSVAEWRGGVTQSLKDIREDMKEIKNTVKDMNNCVTTLKVRVSIISAGIAMFATAALNLVIKWLTK